MAVELVKPVSDLINAYTESANTANNDIKGVVEKFKVIAAKNNLQISAFTKSIIEEINSIKDNEAKLNHVYNQKLNALIGSAKKQVLSSQHTSEARPADYAARVNNALQFLSYQLDTLTDDTAYMILKEFIDDNDQMRLFRTVIDKHMELVEPNGNERFPKTFASLVKEDYIYNLFMEIEPIAKNLFLYNKGAGASYTFGDYRINLQIDGYEEMEGESAIVTIAKDIEDYVAGTS